MLGSPEPASDFSKAVGFASNRARRRRMVVRVVPRPSGRPWLVAAFTVCPTLFPQVGPEHPAACALPGTGFAVDPLLAWANGAGPVHTHAVVVVLVLPPVLLVVVGGGSCLLSCGLAATALGAS